MPDDRGVTRQDRRRELAGNGTSMPSEGPKFTAELKKARFTRLFSRFNVPFTALIE
jgi:hypothetical protein